MRAPQLVAVCLVLIAGMVLFAPGVSAATHTIAAGGHFDQIVTIDSITDVWQYSWSSDVNLHFIVYSPAMVMVAEYTGTSDTGDVAWTSSTGDYMLRWENTGNSPAQLTYTIENIFGDVQHGINTMILVGAIVAVIIIVAIILIVVFVVMAGKKKQAPQQPMAGQVWAPPPVGGRCPNCGSALTAGAKFCEKCGTRFG